MNCSFLAQIGDHNITATAMEPEQTWAGVEKIIEHLGYDGNVLNDIAILRLAQEVRKSFNLCSKFHLPLIRLTFHFSLLCVFHRPQWLQARSLPDRMPQQSGGEHWNTGVSLRYFLLPSAKNSQTLTISMTYLSLQLETTQSLCKSYRTCCLLWQKQIALTTSGNNHRFQSNCLSASPGSSTRTTFIQVCSVLEVQALALTLARATLEVPSLVR